MNRFVQSIRLTTSNDGGRSVHQHYVALRSLFPGQNTIQYLRVFPGATAFQIFRFAGVQTKTVGPYQIFLNLPLNQFAYSGFAGQGNFIQSIAPMNHESMATSQLLQYIGNLLQSTGIVNTYHLGMRSRWIRQGSQ